MKPKIRAFSLIELLVVIAVIATIIALSAGSLGGLFRASAISESVNLVDTDLKLARQASTVTNRTYEIRFLKFADPGSARPEKAYRGYQLFIVDPILSPDEDGYQTPAKDDFDPLRKAAGQITKLPDGIVFVEDSTRSSLLIDASRVPADPQIVIGDGIDAEYRFVRFTADGGSDLARDQDWYLTLAQEGDFESDNLVNFATLEIEPSTGKLIWHRP